MILGPGIVVRDSLSDREDGCESYESVLRHHGPAFAIRGWRGAGAAGADYALCWPRKFKLQLAGVARTLYSAPGVALGYSGRGRGGGTMPGRL